MIDKIGDDKPGAVIRNDDGTTTILNYRFGHGERLRLAAPSEVPPRVLFAAMAAAIKAREVEYRHAVVVLAALRGDHYASGLFHDDWVQAREAARLASDACRATIDSWDHLAVVQAAGRLVWMSESDAWVLSIVRMDGLAVCGACVGVGLVAADGGPAACGKCDGTGMVPTWLPACVKASMDDFRERVEARARRFDPPRSLPEPDGEFVLAVSRASEPEIHF